MKRGLLILLGALGVGLIGFLATRLGTVSIPTHEVHSHGKGDQLPELEWLREEFALSDTEFERIASLHLSYLPTCESLCSRIVAARKQVKELVLSGASITPELEAALRAEASLRADCQVAMLGHLYATAAALPPEKARRYLDAMLPEVLAMTADPGQHHGSH